ncbi:MAG: aldehyde ferredoxin oxidoreductase family protein [Chloroflexi bacterium]|nr:aldehyde ferredoxin oxidoreductase family protein [Chloroflexota bacterium]
MNGWMERIIRVDLTSGKVSVEGLNLKLASEYIGGRGLGAKYLYDEIDPLRVDPLSPENKLIFAPGVATGTRALGSSRYEVMTKSPLTGAIANSSSGGFWGPELKFAGYDMVIFEGKAAGPVYLWVGDDKVELRPAGHLWGKDSNQTQDIIRGETDAKAKVACIGPAGERLVKFAAIMNDEGRAAGRSGVGAVMGSKNLKAVAVRGSKKVPVADEKKLREIVEKAWADVPKPGMLTTYGTPGAVAYVQEAGVFPTRNWQTGVFDGASKIDGEAVNRMLVRRSPCYRCPVACGRITRIADGPYAGEGAGPEYETICSLGSNCGIDNLAAITKANYLCNELGMDTMGCGHTIACAMELFERGFLSQEDVGMRLNFGNAEVMVKLVEMIGHREGFGDILAEGSYRLAEKYGHPELSMSIKKQEIPGYDLRGASGEGLGYVTSCIGADHVRGHLANLEVFGVDKDRLGKDKPAPDRFATQGKAAMLIGLQNESAVSDSMGICNFLSAYKVGVRNILSQLEAITGVEYGLDGFRKVGERVWNLERLFDLKAGLTGADDGAPSRFLKEPMPEGPAKGHVFKLGEMLPEYYRLRGWDSQGRPTEQKLKELGLT